MLNARNRMRSSADFTMTVRSGRRTRVGALVVHHLGSASGENGTVNAADSSAPRVGLIVGKNVGNSVVRHRVSRQLRAQLALRLDRLPVASKTVVRALPQASGAGSAALGHDLDRAFSRLLREVVR